MVARLSAFAAPPIFLVESAVNGMASRAERWSQEVTQRSNALDLEAGVFTWDDPRAIARSLQRSAETSTRRKTTPFRSAMSMLTFYINRAGKDLPEARRQVLEAAKSELRKVYGRSGQAGARRKSS
jgi:hypothetical protein